jgi:hypothetical protein
MSDAKIARNPHPEAFFAGEGRKGGKAGEGGAWAPPEYPTFATFSLFRGPVGEKRRAADRP